MPLKWFKCPDGVEVPVEDCLKSCRLKGEIDEYTGELYCPAGRCLSRRALQAISDERKWNGIPSTTQLLKGTREVYLEITSPYSIEPVQQVYALFGTRVHDKLEHFTPDGGISEQRLSDDCSSGQFDFIDTDGCEPGHCNLIDDKTYGSYVVSKVLRIEKHRDPNGQYKNGKPKYATYFTRDGMFGGWDVAVQLSDYACKIEENLGLIVDNIFVEIIVRDGNTFMAESRGVDKPAYLIPIHRISKHWIKAYMRAKAKRLQNALANKELPPMCKNRERWGDMLCLKYCNGRMACPHYHDLKAQGK